MICELMGFLSRIFGRRSSREGGERPSGQRPPQSVVEPDAVWLYVKCSKCGEVIPLRFRRGEEIQEDIDGECSSPGAVSFIRKEVIGSRCFNRMSLFAEFDSSYRLVGNEVVGGELVNREDYLRYKNANQS